MNHADNFKSKFKRGVSLIHKFDDSLWYSVQCECGDNECGSIVEIEVDDKFKLIELHFYKDVNFDFWRYPDDSKLWLEEGFVNFIKDLYYNKLINGTKRFIYRWKKALILGFTGEIKLHSDFCLIDIDHINDFIEALQEGRDYCAEIKKEHELLTPTAENKPLRGQSQLGSIVDDKKTWGNPGIINPADEKLNQCIEGLSGSNGVTETSGMSGGHYRGCVTLMTEK